MFNAPATAVVSYIVMSKLHLIDNYAAYIIPAFASTLGLYLMKQFMEQMIPTRCWKRHELTAPVRYEYWEVWCFRLSSRR